MKKMLIGLAGLSLATGCTTIQEYLPYQTAADKAELYRKYESYTEAKLELIQRRKEHWENEAKLESEQ